MLRVMILWVRTNFIMMFESEVLSLSDKTYIIIAIMKNRYSSLRLVENEMMKTVLWGIEFKLNNSHEMGLFIKTFPPDHPKKISYRISPLTYSMSLYFYILITFFSSN